LVKTDNQKMLKYPMTDMITIEEFSKSEIRVGKVVKAEDADWSRKLIRLTVDFGPAPRGVQGEREIRIIFTGVRTYGYSATDFQGKQFLFLVNIPPKKMGEEESQGMILAVDGDELPFGEHGPQKPIFVSGEGMPEGAKVR
jgi:methionyl-tRNA synthetase